MPQRGRITLDGKIHADSVTDLLCGVEVIQGVLERPFMALLKGYFPHPSLLKVAISWLFTKAICFQKRLRALEAGQYVVE